MDFERKAILGLIQLAKMNGNFRFMGFIPPDVENKNADKSLKIRKKANQLFGKKKHDAKIHEELWKLYNKSIALAPNNSEELAAGYANRSVLLLHLRKYKECLLDINRALNITESQTLKVKLYCRQNQCHVALQDGKGRASLEKANYWLGRIDDANETRKLEELIKKTKSILTTDVLKSVQKEKEYQLSCENNSVIMSYNEKYGKHLVADRDIHVGELVYIEKFYVTGVSSQKPYAYCSHCLVISWASIPCERCSYYMYCSEECRKDAWQKYHDIECFVKFETDSLLEPWCIQLGLRALILGLKETGSIGKLQELTNEIDKCTDIGKRGLNKDGKFSIDSFKSMYSLNFSIDPIMVGVNASWALDILIFLVQNTCILGKDFKYTDDTDLVNNKDVIFLASLFTRLSSICFVNGFRVFSGFEKCEGSEHILDCLEKWCCSRGTGLSLFTSLINHSCDNNVERFYTNDGRVAYYAIQPIQKNAQIFSSYYVNFMTCAKSVRQKILSSIHAFICDCVACTNEWSGEFKPPHTLSVIENEICERHMKTFKKLKEEKNHRFSKKDIRTFMEDTELLLKSVNNPTFWTKFFRFHLCLLILNRYFKELHVPAECDNNLSK